MACVRHRRGHGEVSAFEDLAALRLIRSRETDDDGDIGLDDVECLQETFRHIVATRDATEDIDEDGVDVLVGKQQFHGFHNLLGVRRATDVEEIGGLPTIEFDHIHRRHGQSGSVDHTSDLTPEVDIAEAVVLGPLLLLLVLVGLEARLDIGMAEEGVVVEGHLRVDGLQRAVLEQHGG